MPQKKPRSQSSPNKFISLRLAQDLVSRYRKAAPASEHAGWFSMEKLKLLLGQRGTGGLRIYHGLDAKGMYRMILVATDDKGNDLLPPRDRLKGGESPEVMILDDHERCPPRCDSRSSLTGMTR